MIYREEYSKREAKGIKYKVLKKLCLGNSIFRNIFYKYINVKEGGQFYSKTLRKIFKEVYDIDAGIGSYGCFTTNFRPHVKIGNYCSIAPGVQRLVGNHPYDSVSTHPLFFNKLFGAVNEDIYHEHKLVIGNDVWIGVNAIITGNCEKIGNGAIIGAGAVVTKNVPDYAVVAGCPAKVIKYRFDTDTINEIEKSEWFNYSPEQLKDYVCHAKDIPVFLEDINELLMKTPAK